MVTADLALWRPERWIRRHYLPWTALVLVLLVLNELNLFGTDLKAWDWLFVSGIITLLIAGRIALNLPAKVHETLDRLARRETLKADPDELLAFETAVHNAARRSTLVWSGILPVVLLVGWIAAKQEDFGRYALVAVLEAVLAGVFAGPFIGRAVSYARLGYRMTEAGLRLDTDPEHLDGAGGLRPVGDLYFFQASVLAVPAAYLGAWWFIFPLLGNRYSEWSTTYVGQLAFAVFLEILAFVAPLWAFHVIMSEEKEEHLRDADDISQQAAATRRRLATASGDERAQLQDELTWLTDRYQAIDAMPTWPVGPRVRLRFTRNNLALLLPVVAQSLGVSDSWQTLLQDIQKTVS